MSYENIKQGGKAWSEMGPLERVQFNRIAEIERQLSQKQVEIDRMKTVVEFFKKSRGMI